MTPYLNPHRLSRDVSLLGGGRQPVVSTPYLPRPGIWPTGRGILTPFNDPDTMPPIWTV